MWKPCLAPLCLRYSASSFWYLSLASFSSLYFSFLSRSRFWLVDLRSLTRLVLVFWKVSSIMPLILLSYCVCWAYKFCSYFYCSALCLFYSICWSSHYFCLVLKNSLLASYSVLIRKITEVFAFELATSWDTIILFWMVIFTEKGLLGLLHCGWVGIVK